MKTLLGLAVLTACAVCAQTPNFAGVWKVDPEKSKFGGPGGGGPGGPPSILILIEQQDNKLTETIGTKTPRGENRSHFTYNLNEKPSNNSLGGIPMRTTAAVEGGALVLSSKIANTKPGTMTEKYTLSPDGNTLTIERTQTMNDREMQQTMVAEKQPDSAAEELRKPEETAGAHYKNVQILKDLPESQLIDTMRNFNMSLGVECNFCHVQGKFDSDEKPTKAMARTMLTMTHGINQQFFKGRMEVRCYTCHKGQQDPASHAAYQ